MFVGPGFVSTSPAFTRRSTRHPAGPHDWLTPKKGNRAPIAGCGRNRHNLHRVCQTNVTALPRVGCVVCSLHNALTMSNQINNMWHCYQYSYSTCGDRSTLHVSDKEITFYQYCLLLFIKKFKQLIKVQNDILSALDAGSSAILLMLDLSAAFDTIDHDILLSRLYNVYGITGNALDWFRSYLTGRIQRVVIENAVSGDQELGFGVPQGSVLGPKIYCMYTKPVSDIIQRHGLSYHSYADDIQLYMTMDHSNNNWRDGLARIQLCVSEIRELMNQNMLKLNDDKTELIVFTSKYKQDLYNDLSITIGNTVVDCSSQVKDLGVIFDRVLSLRQHVSYTSKTYRFHLRNISRIRKYIPQDTSVVLFKSLVLSRLDYSNGLFYGLPKCTLSGLQVVQNSAARIVTQERFRDHDSMSWALIGLHWLSVDKRIEYKMLLYTYKALHDLAPGYLCELVVPYVPLRVLRSAELNLLTVPPGKPGKYGSRSFARASANLWNSLRGERAAWLKNSPTLESFKRNLKTFFFWERFSS